MRILGLTGYAGSGKSTVAQIIREIHPGRVVVKGFADELKRAAMVALGFDDHEAVAAADALKRHGAVATDLGEGGSVLITGRTYLQRFGTEAYRRIDPEVWVRRPFDVPADTELLVTPDVRFGNEAEAIRELGGHIHQVVKPGVGPANGHGSEKPLGEHLVDGMVWNGGDVDELRAEVLELLHYGGYLP